MDDSTGNKVLWFVAGAAVGGALALLYAPYSGEQMRRQIAEKASEGTEKLSASELFEKGRDLYERGRQIADDAAEMFEQGKNLVQGSLPGKTQPARG